MCYGGVHVRWDNGAVKFFEADRADNNDDDDDDHDVLPVSW